MSKIVSVENLEKSYQTKKAINGISFFVNQGEILGFLGPNGAGKSTTLNILSTILSPDSGNINIFGHDLKKDKNFIKRQIGIVPQDLAIYEEIPAIQNVLFFASLYGLKGTELKERAKEALELVELYDRKEDKPKTFSGGMKRRLNIACAIAHKPQLIIMDEPTVGIDPQSRNHILDSIKTLRKKGATIIYSTHYMEEVEAICDRILIMNEGTVIAEGTKEELNKKVNNEVTYSFSGEDFDCCHENDFTDIDGVIRATCTKNQLTVTSNKKDALNKIISVVMRHECTIDNMNVKEASLETIFLQLTGRELKD